MSPIPIPRAITAGGWAWARSLPACLCNGEPRGISEPAGRSVPLPASPGQAEGGDRG